MVDDYVFVLLIRMLVAEVRQEAVQQALAAMQTRPKPSLPMPSKRTSVMADSPRHDTGIYHLNIFMHFPLSLNRRMSSTEREVSEAYHSCYP